MPAIPGQPAAPDAEALLIQVRLAQIADRTVDDALALLSPGERDQFSE